MSDNSSRIIDDWRTRTVLKPDYKLTWFQMSGTNPAVGTSPETIWPVGGLKTWFTTPVSMFITSDAAADTSLTFIVAGTDANFERQIVTVTTNATDGRTPVQVGAALNWRGSATAYQVIPETPHAGNIWFAQGGAVYTLGVPDSTADVLNYIDGTTAFAAYTSESLYGTVLANTDVLLFDYSAEILQSGGAARQAEVAIYVSELAPGATVTNPSYTPFRRIHDLTLDNDVNIHDTYVFPSPLKFGPLTRIEARATATASCYIGGHATAVVVPRDP